MAARRSSRRHGQPRCRCRRSPAHRRFWSDPSAACVGRDYLLASQAQSLEHPRVPLLFAPRRAHWSGCHSRDRAGNPKPSLIAPITVDGTPLTRMLSPDHRRVTLMARAPHRVVQDERPEPHRESSRSMGTAADGENVADQAECVCQHIRTGESLGLPRSSATVGRSCSMTTTSRHEGAPRSSPDPGDRDRTRQRSDDQLHEGWCRS